jgi:quercetin dioxygenase-like cupin family protein
MTQKGDAWSAISSIHVLHGDNDREYHNPEKNRESFTAAVKKSVDLIDYQEGPVVRKTIIDKKTGPATLFAFDQTQKLSEHTVPFDALVHLLDGEARITISEEPFAVKQGEMIIMPANEPHAVEAMRTFTMILTMIRS